MMTWRTRSSIKEMAFESGSWALKEMSVSFCFVCIVRIYFIPLNVMSEVDGGDNNDVTSCPLQSTVFISPGGIVFKTFTRKAVMRRTSIMPSGWLVSLS